MFIIHCLCWIFPPLLWMNGPGLVNIYIASFSLGILTAFHFQDFLLLKFVRDFRNFTAERLFHRSSLFSCCSLPSPEYLTYSLSHRILQQQLYICEPWYFAASKKWVGTEQYLLFNLFEENAVNLHNDLTQKVLYLHELVSQFRGILLAKAFREIMHGKLMKAV